MKLRLLCLGSLMLLSGCGKDFNTGFGEEQGFGGYTKGFGDVDESYKPVGLCSYTGGCMPGGPDDTTPAIGAPNRSSSIDAMHDSGGASHDSGDTAH